MHFRRGNHSPGQRKRIWFYSNARRLAFSQGPVWGILWYSNYMFWYKLDIIGKTVIDQLKSSIDLIKYDQDEIKIKHKNCNPHQRQNTGDLYHRSHGGGGSKVPSAGEWKFKIPCLAPCDSWNESQWTGGMERCVWQHCGYLFPATKTTIGETP